VNGEDHILVTDRKAREKDTTRKTKTIWVDDIKMDLEEIGWGGGVDWIDLPQNRGRWRALVKVVINLQVPQNAGKLLSGYTTGDLSTNAQLHRIS
jgi:hypothetical protein